MDNFSVIKIFFLSTLSFMVAMAWTPLLTHFLYKHRLCKQIRDEKSAPVYFRFHRKKAGTPTMGGLLIWVTVLGISSLFFLLGKICPLDIFQKLNFLTRSETYLPLGALVASALVGLADDLLNVRKIGPHGGGLKMRHRLVVYTFIALAGAYWFYFKLDWDVIRIPFLGNFEMGFWYIPLFIFIIVATSFSVNEIDGLDGLAGGVLLVIFASYGAIAFSQGKMELATFCGVIIGALLAFLWFNISPARFFMGDTGAMSLGVTLGIVAMITNSALLLPIIGFLLVIESLSVIIQIVSKKIRGKKVFISTPIHHHFEAKGWPEPKIVMRFWVIGAASAVIGLAIALFGRGF